MFHILCLQETWLIDSTPLVLHGYTPFPLPALKTSRKGRARGGLAILVSVKLDVKLEVIYQSERNFILSILVTGSWGNGLKALICINAYCPPDKTENPTSFWNELEEAINRCESLHPRAAIVLCGDFNARVGSGLTETVLDSDLEYDEPFLSDRLSLDKVLNKQGRKLAETMSGLQLICLHGSSRDDSKGYFTFLNSRAGSVIDYIFSIP